MIQKYGLWVLFFGVVAVQVAYIGTPYSLSSGPDSLSLTTASQPVNWLVYCVFLSISAVIGIISVLIRYVFLIRHATSIKEHGFKVIATLSSCWFLSVLVAANGLTVYMFWFTPVLTLPFTLFGLYLTWFHAPNRLPQQTQIAHIEK